MIPSEVKSAVCDLLRWPDFSCRAMSGGDINQVFRLDHKSKTVILKLNSRKDLPRMFELEQSGLEAIAGTKAIKTPEVLGVVNTNEGSALLLEYIDVSSERTPGFWSSLGEGLANMHRFSSPVSGWNQDNYIGSLQQVNKEEASWVKFYREHRILHFAFRAKNLLGAELMSDIERLCTKLGEIIPEERSSLLHGDIWSGNYLCSDDQAYLIDPAVYFGSREVDLAMTRLFGGFEPMFYQVYNDTFQLEKGWESRIELYQLYPLLVHVNLFGSTYVPSVRACVNQYVG